ncbi:DUF805 domain-containing protein [Marinicauda algicola]|uniref:DUF805 domain-containing protein n=1 Tax=Marinicauda algicola TaxID=2029849 RepID=A0A4S2H2Y6_9PROT|nr:DUF805 domain-containing protein [Marinicauda algicola]TGY89701.1 DUF805 domain-containing protein [Marinicauda algicola]
MNIGQVLFNPNGRIGQQEYWIGILIIIAGNIVAGFIPILGFIISLGLIYVGVCVYGKRLHDAGKSAWIHAVPWAVSIVLGVLGMIFAGGAVMSAMMAGNGDMDPMAALAAGGTFALFMGLSFLVWVVYTIWVGVLKGDPGANRFGEAPGTQAVASAPSQGAGGSEPPAGQG